MSNIAPPVTAAEISASGATTPPTPQTPLSPSDHHRTSFVDDYDEIDDFDSPGNHFRDSIVSTGNGEENVVRHDDSEEQGRLEVATVSQLIEEGLSLDDAAVDDLNSTTNTSVVKVSNSRLNSQLPYHKFTDFELSEEYGNMKMSLPNERYSPVYLNERTGSIHVLGKFL